MSDELNRALEQHQKGFLDQAARLYRTVLAAQPDNADAMHLLGVIAFQQKEHARALEWINRAIAIHPQAPAFHANLAEVLREMGQLDQAVASCRAALRLQPAYPEVSNTLGLILLAQGQFEVAAVQFRIALQQRPEFAMARNNLGTAMRFKGDLDSALAHFRQAVQLAPDLPEARSNLGQVLMEMGKPDEALVHSQQAVRLRPHFAEGHANLGNVLRDLGKLAEAKECYLEALRLNPTVAMFYSNVGQVLYKEGKIAEAVNWYRQGLQQDPNMAKLHGNLAGCLTDLNRAEEAVTAYRDALRLEPQYAEAHNGLGWVLHEQGHDEEAEQHYRAAITLAPQMCVAYCNLATLREELNDSAGARQLLREAVRRNPRYCEAWGQLATTLRSRLPPQDEQAMRQLLRDPAVSEGDRAVLHFGLAQVLDARRDYTAAAEQLHHANALMHSARGKNGLSYDLVAHAKFIDRSTATFSPAFFKRVGGFGVASERPIFIIGMPRSGTTLTEQILAHHSQVFGAGELRLTRRAFDTLLDEDTSSAIFERMSQIDEETVQRLANQHLEQLQRLNPTALRVVDKMPENYLYLGFLAAMFPRAKFIHCRRDARDVALSCWMTNFRQIYWATDIEQIVTRFQDYWRLMDHWRAVLPVPLLEVDYEETVADLEGVSRRLVAWCGLDWEQACLNFHEVKGPVRTASLNQVRQPIYTSSVGRWKHYEPALGELFARLQAAPPRVESST